MAIIIPTMHISNPQLSDISEMIVYVLRHFTSIPSGISNTFSEEEISFHKLAAETEHDPKSLSSVTSDVLSKVYRNLFPNSEVSVQCTPTTIDESRYALSVEIQVITDDDVVQLQNYIKVDDNKQVKLEF
jgi:hypothetical protein